MHTKMTNNDNEERDYGIGVSLCWWSKRFERP